jgi:hypothetical protein
MAAVMDPAAMAVAASARMEWAPPCEMAGCRSGSGASSVVVHFGHGGRSSGYADASNVDERIAIG